MALVHKVVDSNFDEEYKVSVELAKPLITLIAEIFISSPSESLMQLVSSSHETVKVNIQVNGSMEHDDPFKRSRVGGHSWTYLAVD